MIVERKLFYNILRRKSENVCGANFRFDFWYEKNKGRIKKTIIKIYVVYSFIIAITSTISKYVLNYYF